MKISIFGLGYVGAVSLATLARDGHEVIGVDIDPDKLDLIKQGKSPIVEDGMAELMADAVTSGRVHVTNDCATAITASDLSFVCVGTPSSANGSQDLSAMRRVAEQIGAALATKAAFHTVVIRSTVSPGTVADVIRPALEHSAGKRADSDFGLCFQPEFLREGSSISDYDNPPMTVVGGADERSIAQLRSLFGHLPNAFISCELGAAEMLKYACNAFHALKVTFANEIGRVAQAVHVDGRDVMKLLCEDKSLNISPAYLRPGFAFGGSCLPKDLRAVVHLAKMRDVNVPLLGSLLPSNRVHIDHAIDTVLSSGKRRVGMVGLSFKSGTDDLRESPLVALAERFIGKGLELAIHDPEVSMARLIGSNRAYIEANIPHISSLLVDDCQALVENCDVLILGLNDSHLVQVVRDHCHSGQLLLDLIGIPEPDALAADYRGACW